MYHHWAYTIGLIYTIQLTGSAVNSNTANKNKYKHLTNIYVYAALLDALTVGDEAGGESLRGRSFRSYPNPIVGLNSSTISTAKPPKKNQKSEDGTHTVLTGGDEAGRLAREEELPDTDRAVQEYRCIHSQRDRERRSVAPSGDVQQARDR